MSMASGFKPSNPCLRFPKLNATRQFLLPSSSPSIPNPSTSPSIRLSLTLKPHRIPTHLLSFSGGDGGDGGHISGGGGGGGGGDRGDENEAMMAVAEMGREMESLPKDLAGAIASGKIPRAVVERFFELEKSPVFKWLLGFTGFRERLLADDLFFAKVFIECGVGMFTKTAAEYQKRKENFFNELEVVFADVVMAVLADFMLVYLPAPTVALRAPLNVNAGSLAKFFYGCPDNAFQIALGGTSYSFLQRFGAVVRNGSKLFAVGTASSLVGTVVTNAMINAKKAVAKSGADEVENVPVLATSAAYGIYMSISSNLRYQILAGVIEQRLLEPVLHQHKLLLSAICFAIRTGNTFLGSLLGFDCTGGGIMTVYFSSKRPESKLLKSDGQDSATGAVQWQPMPSIKTTAPLDSWVDYARFIGLQKAHEVDPTHSTA